MRDSMVGSNVPTGMRDAHQQVVAAIDRAISAVQSADDGIEQSRECFSFCYYRDTPGWQQFLSESDGIGKLYATSMTQREAAVEATQAAIANRALPDKPQV